MADPRYPPYPAQESELRRARLRTVARVLIIVGVVVLAVLGLSLVAACVLTAVALANFGSNK